MHYVQCDQVTPILLVKAQKHVLPLVIGDANFCARTEEDDAEGLIRHLVHEVYEKEERFVHQHRVSEWKVLASEQAFLYCY